METMIALLPPALLTLLLVRLLFVPLQFVFRLSIHSGCGFACLWLLNTAAPLTGVTIPINGITVLTAGFGGLPGIGLLTLLEVWG